MKIHKLEIENIASLRGEHQIDFDELFQESSLFAITGKTGAGKSTILNCISLALYGKVYKKDSDGLDFVTLGEAQGSIALTFSNLGQKYQAHWHLKLRKKNGELYKKPQLQRNLAKVGSDDDVEYVEADIDQVIGLTFDQFCKTTILNQGQFAKFLTSNFKDRKDILEKFYQGIDLETLNLKLNEKIRLKKATLEEAENQIKGHTQAFEHIEVTPEEVQKLKELSQEAAQRKSILDLCNSTFKDIKGSFKTIDENKVRLELTNKQLEVDQNAYNILKKESDTISKSLTETEKIISKEKPDLLSGIKKYNDKTKRLEQVEYLNQRYTKNIELNEITLSEQKTLELKKNKIKTQKESLLSNNPLFEKLAPKEIRLLISSFVTVLSEQKKNQEALTYTEAQITEFKKEMQSLSDTIQSLESILNKQSEADLDHLIIQNKDHYQRLSRFQDHQKRYQELNRSLRKDIKDFTLKEESKGNQLEELESQIEKLTEEINISKKAYKFTELGLAVHTCRIESIGLGECVVCHSTYKESDDNTLQVDNLEMERIQKRIEKQTSELAMLQEKTTKVKLEKLSITSKKESLALELKELKASSTIEFHKVSDLEVKEDSSLTYIQGKVSFLLEEEKKIQKARLSYSNELTKKTSTESEINKVKNRINDLRKRSTDLKKIIEKNSDELKMLSSKLYLKTVDSSTIETLKRDSESFEALLESEALLEKDIKNLLTNLEKLTQEIDSLKSEIETNQKEITLIDDFLRDKLNSTQDPLIKLNQLEDNQRNQKNEALENTKELSKIEVKLAEHKSKSTNFKEQIVDSKLMIESLKEKLRVKLLEVSALKSESESSATGLSRLLANLSELDTEDNLISEILNETQIYLEDASTLASYDAKDSEKAYTEKSNDLTRKIENEKRVALLNKQTVDIRSQMDQLTNLYELIGKDEFRNYILSLIETTLIDQTNRELESLYQGRYSIVQTHKKNRAISEFKIVDYFRDGLSRKVSTLSGGETFLVSLAMALALAELTRGTTQIDSLFIDEGFGTLDQDSIDEVFELLEKIQHSGKQIGIISHVQSLTSRIGLNINLEKNTHAVSTINIIYN